jgi:hypothetical protein
MRLAQSRAPQGIEEMDIFNGFSRAGRTGFEDRGNAASGACF